MIFNSFFNISYAGNFRENHKNICKLINKYQKEYPFTETTLSVSIYDMKETINYEKLKIKINNPDILNECNIQIN